MLPEEEAAGRQADSGDEDHHGPGATHSHELILPELRHGGVSWSPGHTFLVLSSMPRGCCKARRPLLCAQRKGRKDGKADLAQRGNLACLFACFSWQ